MMITRTLNATYLILPLTNIPITVTVHKPMEIVGSLSCLFCSLLPVESSVLMDHVMKHLKMSLLFINRQSLKSACALTFYNM